MRASGACKNALDSGRDDGIVAGQRMNSKKPPSFHRYPLMPITVQARRTKNLQPTSAITNPYSRKRKFSLE